MMPYRAYSDLYVNNAQTNLGEYFDYAINDCGYSPDEATGIFLKSSSAEQLETGDIRYAAGMSGTEMFLISLRDLGMPDPHKEYMGGFFKSPEYWAGWVTAYYQWYRNVKFKDIFDKVSFNEILSHYILHEAPLEKFVVCMDSWRSKDPVQNR